VQHESGIARTVDPFGGGYYVEWLTDRMEAEILQVMRKIDDYGGVVKAIEDGWLQMRIAERALERKIALDEGTRVVVGVNRFRREDEKAGFGEVFRLDPDVSRKVVEKYEAVRQSRNGAEVERTLARLEAAAAKDRENLMPYLVDCCHAYATVGEMVQRLKNRWGEFQEPVRL
jgi:methylmalonyl-CoA mutase N-terminal domain/subunit